MKTVPMSMRVVGSAGVLVVSFALATVQVPRRVAIETTPLVMLRLSDDAQPGRQPTWRLIAGQNIRVALFMTAGLVTGGLTSLVALTKVGYGIGRTLSEAIASGLPLRVIAAALMPHGVLEISGFLLASAAGLFGIRLLASYVQGTPLQPREFRNGFGLPSLLALVILIVAAWLECSLTPMVIQWTTSAR